MDLECGSRNFSPLGGSMCSLKALAGLLLCLLASCGEDPDKPFHRDETHFRVVRESLYTRIVVERDGNNVEMRFRSGRHAPRQSAVDLSDPSRLLLPYSSAMMAAALVQPRPRRILLIGLGGGAVNRFLQKAFPEAETTTVELDEAVFEAARSLMGFQPGIRDKVVIADGRACVQRSSETWDWILVDAYRGGWVPAHLKTREFYDLLNQRLADGGVVVFNLHANSRLFESDKATLNAAFKEVHLISVPGTSNIIALAFSQSSAALPALPPASGTSAFLMPHLEAAARNYLGEADPGDAKVLTDDFSPAEFLDQQPASSPR